MDEHAKGRETPSLKAALARAKSEVDGSPDWLKLIYKRNRAIAAAMRDDSESDVAVLAEAGTPPR